MNRPIVTGGVGLGSTLAGITVSLSHVEQGLRIASLAAGLIVTVLAGIRLVLHWNDPIDPKDPTS